MDAHITSLANGDRAKAARVLLVSNRLPVTVALDEQGAVNVSWSAGGLATGLRGAYKCADSLWIGWPGLPDLPGEAEEAVAAELERFRCSAVHLSADEIRASYEDVANGVLWPAFHYELDRLPAELAGWDVFRRVNERFAEAVARHYRPGDLIWVHDYQLCLVPAILRRLIPDAPIGFFFHIPFPSSEVFSVIPWREELLTGLLGADLIGFHTASYLRHFATTLRRVLCLEVDIETVQHSRRETHLGVFPMGVDVPAWSELGARADVTARASEIRGEDPEQRILLGIDRLDYTKGIPRRILAIDRLLSLEPDLRGKVRFVQVTVPSRENVESYASFSRDLDELIGHVNSTWATENWVPIHNLHRSLPQDEIAALYRASDVMLVTPVRDGMNLVAKEFVASRGDDDGVLILSEFAGAAVELSAALHVNPYDVDAMALRIREALAMPADERRRRMQALRAQVGAHDIRKWADAFVGRLAEVVARRDAAQQQLGAPYGMLVAELRAAEAVLVLLDYDGTLVPFAPTPEQAAPDRPLLTLLNELASRPRTEVHILSGRDHATLGSWFAGLPVGLHAEHGFWSRWPGSGHWTQCQRVSDEWKERIRPILEYFTRATPGSFVEEKPHSLAWHYRLATDDFVGGCDFGEHQGKELRLLLVELLGRAPLNVLAGNRVVEVRPEGVSKGAAAPLILDRHPGATVVAIGDDTTDEDLFRALPSGALTVHVGAGPSVARFRLPDHDSVRRLLSELCERAPAAVGVAPSPSGRARVAGAAFRRWTHRPFGARGQEVHG